MQAPNFCAPLKPPTKYSVESYEPDDEPEPSKNNIFSNSNFNRIVQQNINVMPGYSGNNQSIIISQKMNTLVNANQSFSKPSFIMNRVNSAKIYQPGRTARNIQKIVTYPKYTMKITQPVSNAQNVLTPNYNTITGFQPVNTYKSKSAGFIQPQRGNMIPLITNTPVIQVPVMPQQPQPTQIKKQIIIQNQPMPIYYNNIVYQKRNTF